MTIVRNMNFWRGFSKMEEIFHSHPLKIRAGLYFGALM
jgi:hypothetical protein